MTVTTATKKKMCPFCQCEIEAGAVTVECNICKIPHHSDCWQENGRCTTYGCNGTAVRAFPSQGAVRLAPVNVDVNMSMPPPPPPPNYATPPPYFPPSRSYSTPASRIWRSISAAASPGIWWSVSSASSVGSWWSAALSLSLSIRNEDCGALSSLDPGACLYGRRTSLFGSSRKRFGIFCWRCHWSMSLLCSRIPYLHLERRGRVQYRAVHERSPTTLLWRGILPMNSPRLRRLKGDLENIQRDFTDHPGFGFCPTKRILQIATGSSSTYRA